jgi:hypothetical protein
MNESTMRDRVLEEIQHIPEDKLTELYHVIHHFRLGLQVSAGRVKQIMQFAGSWGDMPEEMFAQVTEEIAQRRRHAFAGRRGRETCLD